jgi:hypothetical protein
MTTQFSFFLFMLLLGGLAVSFAVTLWARSRGRPTIARVALRAAGAGVAVYAACLFGAGLFSHTAVLAPTAEKYFCELDCHLAYQVLAVRSLPAGDKTEVGMARWEVLLQTRFDETTISARRSRVAPTWPAPRRLELVGGDGQRYPLRASTEMHGSTALTEPLVPGARYATRLEAELPSGVTPSQLQLQDDLFLTQLLIGNERSPFHAPVLLALPAPSPSAS